MSAMNFMGDNRSFFKYIAFFSTHYFGCIIYCRLDMLFFKKGYSLSISSIPMPPAKDSRITSTDMRVPLIMGLPPKIAGFCVMYLFIN